MIQTNLAVEAPRLGSADVALLWGRHLLTFVYPALTLAFLWTAPHSWWGALLWIVPSTLLDFLDDYGGHERRQPPADLPAAPFDALLYAHFALQVVTLLSLLRLFTVQGFWSMDAFMAVQFVGFGSGVSGIVVAHELIHRKERHLRAMGRVLMGSVLYDHFAIEHVRGHHVRVATGDDPATARYGERFWPFFRRTVPAQLRSAWRLESRRLGDEDMALLDRRQLRNKVLHGLALEWAFALAVLLAFGAASFGVFVLQAALAVLSLEVVNYFEHWGLERSGRRVRPQDSWDSDARFTYYALVGLTRHADHHANASRPYQSLRLFDESPKLPRGYHGMLRLALFRNGLFQQQMTEELRRRGLGPFARRGDEPAAAPG